MHYGLIGQSLQHSFSPAFFAARFTDWGLSKTHTYRAFELPTIEDFPALLQAKKLSGLNVTIPYKESIIPFLDELHPDAAAIGAVNTIALDENGRTHGYNTDVVGLQISLDRLCGHKPPQQALIIGKGTHTHTECKHICKLFSHIICNQTPQPYTQNAPPNHASASPKHAHQGSQR